MIKTYVAVTWRIIPVSKWLVTPIYKPFRPFIRGITPVRGLRITMVTNHVSKSWDDPPSSDMNHEILAGANGDPFNGFLKSGYNTG